ncbi:MAG: hypothetical protein UV98_C0024G0013 [Parcubacteria group bacterium GW2011_GWB1_43_6]|uniref:Uncharacterized protein n=1 Tax=Candidatus Giovannonibacteria bacterium GW2011_GWA2_45_21 TaxID=1618649 RepID=A0A0G1M830_9BACT|nr:MAG: hypothetical protein UV98_C0024G0013 [Parcubacteria group bacterium GW2011_GWB1_43_6]KKU04421.1 MAG: hypothetical protein UX06_C0019G0010 [Candidatus Giovannonibacteria bacterium GW2011_GWA2_45_21]
MADNRREWRGPDFSITSFEVSEPVKQDGVWDVVAVVVVSYRKREAPRETQRVIFEAGGKTVEVVETDDEGRASYVYSFDKPGSWLIAIQLEGMPGTRRTKRVSIKEEKPKPAVVKDIVIQYSGKPGDYEVVGQVVAEGAAEKRRIRINEARGLQAEDVKETDENGCFKFSAKFGELERTYIVTDIGSGLERRVRLFGSPY